MPVYKENLLRAKFVYRSGFQSGFPPEFEGEMVGNCRGDNRESKINSNFSEILMRNFELI